MNLIINSAASISGAGYSWSEDFLSVYPQYHADRLLASEPDYTAYIPAMQLRRMSKVVRMSMAAAKYCMAGVGMDKPDAINVGTAFGCVQDTLFFLSKLVGQDEQMLTPTAFIQSTHNTVAGQIALLYSCYGQNLTFSQRGHSFEHTLINAQLYLDAHAGHKLLVGGVDELTDISIEVLRNMGIYHDAPVDAADIFTSLHDGTVAGEGAAFFLVSGKPLSDHHLVIKDIFTFGDDGTEDPLQMVNDFLKRNDIDASGIDCVLLGISSDEKTAGFYSALRQQFSGSSICAFKHFSGEYGTASSFALSAIMHIAHTGHIPASLLLEGKADKPQNILFINSYGRQYSCWFISLSV